MKCPSSNWDVIVATIDVVKVWRVVVVTSDIMVDTSDILVYTRLYLLVSKDIQQLLET